MTKERIFEIMGKYYGNAHRESAIRLKTSEHDLRLVTEMLDKINGLGYYFSNLGKLGTTEDIRFVPIILDYYERFDAEYYRSGVLTSICYPSYSCYIPRLLTIYRETTFSHDRIAISQCLLQMRCKQYIPEYLELINRPDYGNPHDLLVDLLCKLQVKEVIPKLLALLQSNPHGWTWTFLKYAASFRDPSLLPHIEVFLDSPDGEYRSMARKAIKKIRTNGRFA